MARTDVVICLSLIAKKAFNTFDEKADRDLYEFYTNLSDLENEIQNETSIYFLLKEDFDIIKSNLK
jgi:hypothetical protein